MLKEQSIAKRTLTGKLISSGLSVRNEPFRETWLLAWVLSRGGLSEHPI